VVCFQHFTGTINNFDPIHTNRLAQDRPVLLVDYRGVGRSGGKTPDSMPAIAADIIAFVKALGLKEIAGRGNRPGNRLWRPRADAPKLPAHLWTNASGHTQRLPSTCHDIGERWALAFSFDPLAGHGGNRGINDLGRVRWWRYLRFSPRTTLKE
jgi:hypothetical protein